MVIKTLEDGKVYNTNVYGNANGVNAYFGKEIRQIRIYGHGEILFSINGSSIDPCYINGKNHVDHNGYMHNVKSITLKQAFKRATKLNLTRTDNYYMTYTDGYFNGYALYIHESEISVNYVGEYVCLEHDGETDYCHIKELVFNNGATKTEYIREEYATIEELNTKYPLNNLKFDHTYGSKDIPVVDCFDFSKTRFGNVVARREAAGKLIKGYTACYTEEQPLNSVYVRGYGYSRQVKTDERKEREAIAELFEKAGIKASHYDIDKLMQYVTITIK